MLKAGLVLSATAACAFALSMAVEHSRRDARAEAFISRMRPFLELAATKPHTPETAAIANQLAVRMVQSVDGAMHLIFYTDDSEVCITGLGALGPDFELVIVNGEVARTRQSLTTACRTAVKPRIVARIKATTRFTPRPEVGGLH